MKLSWQKRMIRFLFGPIALLTMITLMRYDAIYKTIYDYCEQRAECYSSCVRDNFPNMNCITIEDKELEYNGNKYSKFFFYPKPEIDKLGHYKMCEDYINYLKLYILITVGF